MQLDRRCDLSKHLFDQSSRPRELIPFYLDYTINRGRFRIEDSHYSCKVM